MKLPFEVVTVNFPAGDKDYAYFVPTEWKVASGDYLLVYVSDEPKIVRVTLSARATPEHSRAKAHRIAALHLTKTHYEQFLQMQQSLESYRDMRKRLEEMRRQRDELEVFRELAKDDPEAQALLDQFLSADTTIPALTFDKKD